MSKHTPAPWLIHKDKPGRVITRDGMLVAKCGKANGPFNREMNAVLISQAPILLEVSMQLLASCSILCENADLHEREVTEQIMKNARIVIKRARGES